MQNCSTYATLRIFKNRWTDNLERILTILITFALAIYSLLLGFSKNHVSFAGRISGSPLDDGQSADSSFQCRAASSSPAPTSEAALDSCSLPSLVYGSAADSVKGLCIHSLVSAHVQAKQQQAVKGSFVHSFACFLFRFSLILSYLVIWKVWMIEAKLLKNYFIGTFCCVRRYHCLLL